MHPKMNHNALDELINESAHHQSYPYLEEDWNDMASMLDARDKRRSRRKILFIILSLGIILTGALVLWRKAESNEKKTSTNTSVAAVSQDDSSNTKIATPPKNVSISQNESIRIVKDISANNSIENKINHAIQAPTIISNEIEIVKNSKSNQDLTSSNQSTIKHTETKTGEPSKSHSEKIGQKLNTKNIAIAALVNEKILLPEHNWADNLDKAKIQKIESHNNPWSLSLFANPEWSAATISSNATRGWRIGASINYDLGTQWQINAGLAYSKKMYKGAGHTFTKESGWMENVSPELIDGKCYVIDIPITASYYFNSTKQRGWYMQGGMSSYIISSEWYGFTYSQNSLNFLNARGVVPLDEITINNNKNNHWVGVGSLAFGYQGDINKHMGYNIAPYVSIPLNGIGEGQVKLNSAGIKLGINIR